MTIVQKAIIIGGLVLSFVIGFGVSAVFLSDGNADIPYGTYAPMVLMNGLSYEINLSLTVIDKDNELVTTWIREDREAPFAGQTGIRGQTMFTHLTVNCKNYTVGVFEQRAFDSKMKYIGTGMGSGILEPSKSLVGVSTLASICGTPEQDEDPDAPSTESHSHPYPLPSTPTTPLMQT